jgi:pimeloyl-ACP methyl ester carboxylesterase
MALITAILWGALAGWWMPRGPLTGVQALGSVALSAAVGLIVARWARSRWARSRWIYVLLPLLFWIALELARARVRGPSVDLPHGSLLGVVVLVAGRGLQALLTAFPMLLALAWGRGVTGRPGQAATAVVTGMLLLFTVDLALPARTASIPGPDSVADLTDVGGLGVMIRGARATAPVLLFVPGAPGGTERGAVRHRLGAVEQRFVMVTLDRRGGGASYPALDPTGRVTLDQQVGDILAVTDYLRSRFHQDKIYLLGHSGGSVPAVLAVVRHPEKYLAYVGSGQAVDLPASDRIFYDDIIAWARRTGHDDVAARLTRQGPPPYRSVWAYEPFLIWENTAYAQRDDPLDIGVRELTLLQKVHTLNAILDTWDVLYPRMQAADLRRDAPAVPVPVWFVQGGNEMRGLSVLFDEWYGGLAAPRKHLVTLPGAGHRVMFEQPAAFAKVLDDVLAG